MSVEIPLQIGGMPGDVTLASIHEALSAAYSGERFVTVASLEEARGLKTLDPLVGELSPPPVIQPKLSELSALVEADRKS